MKFAKQVNLYCYKENPMQMGLSSTVWANTFGCLQTAHSVLNQGFSYTVLHFFYKTLQTFSLVLTSLDMMFEQWADLIS